MTTGTYGPGMVANVKHRLVYIRRHCTFGMVGKHRFRLVGSRRGKATVVCRNCGAVGFFQPYTDNGWRWTGKSWTPDR